MSGLWGDSAEWYGMDKDPDALDELAKPVCPKVIPFLWFRKHCFHTESKVVDIKQRCRKWPTRRRDYFVDECCICGYVQKYEEVVR